MLVQDIIYIPVLLSLAGITLFILSRNIKSSVNLTFGLFTLATTLWLFGLFKADTTAEIGSALFWTRFAIFCSSFIPLFFLMFATVYPENKKIKIVKFVPSILVACFLASVSYTNLMVGGVQLGEYTSQPTQLGTAYTIFLIYLASHFLLSFVILLKKMRRVSDNEKSRIKLVLVGTVIGVLTNIVFNFIFVLMGQAGIGLLLGGPSVLIFTSFVAYAIVKHRLFDIRLVVARTVAYLASISTIVLVYAGIIYIISRFLFPDTAIIVARQGLFIFSAITLGLLFQPIKKFFDKNTNKLFYRDAYDPQSFLDALNKELVSNIDLESLLHKCSEIIETNLKPQFCLFGLKETAYSEQRVIGTREKKFEQSDIDLARSLTPYIKKTVIVADEIDEGSPLKELLGKNEVAILARLATDLNLETEGLGYILLGSKKSGNPYNKQDLRMIEIITNELVIAIQNALRFEEIEKFNITLQDKVDDATRELRRTNEKLKQMDETKDEFISMASHQLRTPLTSVKGYLSMVLEGNAGDVGEMQRKLLDQAFVSSQRMVYLIADLLNVSRLRTGKFVIEPVESNLADVVEGEVGQLKQTAAGRGLELIYTKPENFPALYLDETKIRQVVMNFTDNAIYYTTKGGHIDVKLEDKGESIELTITDDGMGVPKSEQPHLFTKFYRAGNAQKARPDGTGLGLFMAKKVIIAQGGSVIFRSEEGKGSTFGFSFPKAKLKSPVMKDEGESTTEAQKDEPASETAA